MIVLCVRLANAHTPTGAGAAAGPPPHRCEDDERQSAERPGEQDRHRHAGRSAVEEPGAAQQVRSGPGRQQLADPTDRLRQHLGRRAAPENGLPMNTISTAAMPMPTAAEPGVEAGDGRADGQHGQAEHAGVRDPVALDDVEPALDDRRRDEPDDRRGPPTSSPARPAAREVSSEAATPIRIPAITSGSTDDGSAAPCSAVTTSSVGAPVSAAAWPSS